VTGSPLLSLTGISPVLLISRVALFLLVTIRFTASRWVADIRGIESTEMIWTGKKNVGDELGT
jgi:hypothetical protein